ncbi:S8 family serine peptidase [Microcella sp.]|uniref:S8 family serine peptidase n=1 Tax=Microcella sp. TaxID=1913979 RepID=UPI00255EEAF2|nr:S8 family serine peptidase [Microcella sp.]MBX9471070.1 S8 family serine peptidase [Microcella sp.]
MPDGPIQVVLRPESFREDRARQNGGGARKDFYRDQDHEFSLHRDEIARVIRVLISKSAHSRRVNVTVLMRPDALAKSHRPFQSLFRQTRASHVGTDDYGELIFAVTPANLRKILQLVESAETDVAWRVDTLGVQRYAPSPMRTEVGAIQNIREWSPADARGFTLDEAEEWLSENPSTRAEVELFDIPAHGSLRDEAIEGIRQLATRTPTFSSLFELSGAARAVLGAQPALERPRPQGVAAVRSRAIDSSAFREELARLEASALVKRVALGDAPAAVSDDTEPVIGQHQGSPRRDGAARPVIGVIDGGIDWQDPGTAGWIVGHNDYIAPEHRSVRRVVHGTSIASLIAIGADLNPSLLDVAEDCRVYDLGLFPAEEYVADYYPTPLEDFIDVLRESVQRAKSEQGVRVFNLSYNFRRAPGSSFFSPIARELDQIANDLDVIFVISVGNLPETEIREEWPSAEGDVVAMIARSRARDGLGVPAESIANVSVGATNPPGMATGIEGAPTRYTRRASPVPSALKPDFAAPGGGVRVNRGDSSGLRALNSVGNIIEVEGTSFASPLVARYLASLDEAITGDVPREVLLGLATHHAQLPPVLRRSETIADLATSFVGRGLLPSVSETLDGAAHRMTIVLSDIIQPRKRVMFPFRWPDSLTSTDGKCRGTIKLTLVSQPKLNHAHGSEAVRINLDGSLKQLDPRSGSFGSQVRPSHEFFSGYTYANERTLMTELGKWFPIKSFERTMRGVGRSSDWLLEIGYLTRASELLPEQGVRFAAILTIEDPAGEAPVHDEMRASLTTIGVALNDLRAWTNVGVRT